MNCIICDREALGNYCEIHEKAYQNIIQNFEDWQRATSVSWKEYLKELVKNAYTGTWAKEVAEYLLKNKDR